jgi:hypothetical protein
MAVDSLSGEDRVVASLGNQMVHGIAVQQHQLAHREAFLEW